MFSATSTRLAANQTTRPCVEEVHGTRTNDTRKKREPEGKIDEKDSMKFGKLLRNTAEAQPEWADAYLDYKLLKKKLKALKRNEEDTGETRRKKKHERKRRTKTCESRRSTDHARRTDVSAENEHRKMHVQRTAWKPMREDVADETRAATNVRCPTHVESIEPNGGAVQLSENRSTTVDARNESQKGAGSSQVRVRVPSLRKRIRHVWLYGLWEVGGHVVSDGPTAGPMC